MQEGLSENMMSTIRRQAESEDPQTREAALKLLASFGITEAEKPAEATVSVEDLLAKAASDPETDFVVEKTLENKEPEAEKPKPEATENGVGEDSVDLKAVEGDVEEILSQIDNPKHQKRELEKLLDRHQSLEARKFIYKQIDEVEPDSKKEPVDTVEINRQLEYVLNPINFPDIKKQRAAAERWLKEFDGKAPVEKITLARSVMVDVEPEKISEVDAEPGSEIRAKMEIDMRMAMIDEMNERVRSTIDIASSFDNFIARQARNYGYGKTHFPKEFQEELKIEYFARAELAAGMAFWDENGDSKDLLKSLDRMRTLSTSTYRWLAQEKKGIGYKTTGEIERKTEVELRGEMNTVAQKLYVKMMTEGGFNIALIRGEDRLSKIKELAIELNVSIDAVKLTWQLAETECWAARRPIGFVGHPLGKVVLAAEARDFKTRKGLSVIGGTRLWGEYLKDHGNVYPEGLQGQFSTLGAARESVYEKEGKRLARVGFEAWTVKISDAKDKNGQPIDPRCGNGVRDGIISLYSEKGGFPVEWKEFSENHPDKGSYKIPKKGDKPAHIVSVEPKKGLSKAVKELNKEVHKLVDGKDKNTNIKLDKNSFAGGEKALLAGQYFTCMEWLVNQPGFEDYYCPSNLMKGDMIKGAAALEAMEALGNIEVGKASVKELRDLREALVAVQFRFQSNDLIDRGGKKREVRVKGKSQEWEIPSGTQEKFTKARIKVGEMMEEWTRSYVWLLSWENPSRTSENQVTPMGDWIRLARSVAQTYDTNHQWGDFVGYGYGNYDGNELAVDEEGKPRQKRTEEMKQAAEGYTKWFNKTFFQVAEKVLKRRIPFMTSKQRIDKEITELREYNMNPFFWKGSWWR